MVSQPAEKKEAFSSAARQLGEWHPSRLMSSHSFNWQSMYQVCQRLVVEGSIILKMACGPMENRWRNHTFRPQGSYCHPSKNMPSQSLNWHGVSQADSVQGADFMREQTNTNWNLVHHSKILITSSFCNFYGVQAAHVDLQPQTSMQVLDRISIILAFELSAST